MNLWIGIYQIFLKIISFGIRIILEKNLQIRQLEFGWLGLNNFRMKFLDAHCYEITYKIDENMDFKRIVKEFNNISEGIHSSDNASTHALFNNMS